MLFDVRPKDSASIHFLNNTVSMRKLLLAMSSLILISCNEKAKVEIPSHSGVSQDEQIRQQNNDLIVRIVEDYHTNRKGWRLPGLPGGFIMNHEAKDGSLLPLDQAMIEDLEIPYRVRCLYIQRLVQDDLARLKSENMNTLPSGTGLPEQYRHEQMMKAEEDLLIVNRLLDTTK